MPIEVTSGSPGAVLFGGGGYRSRSRKSSAELSLGVWEHLQRQRQQQQVYEAMRQRAVQEAIQTEMKQLDEREDEIRALGAEQMDPHGQAAFDQLMQERNRIETARFHLGLSPEQYLHYRRQWQSRADYARFHTRVIRRPTAAEQLEQQRVVDPVTGAILSFDRNGTFRQIRNERAEAAAKAAEDKAKEEAKENEALYSEAYKKAEEAIDFNPKIGPMTGQLVAAWMDRIKTDKKQAMERFRDSEALRASFALPPPPNTVPAEVSPMSTGALVPEEEPVGLYPAGY